MDSNLFDYVGHHNSSYFNSFYDLMNNPINSINPIINSPEKNYKPDDNVASAYDLLNKTPKTDLNFNNFKIEASSPVIIDSMITSTPTKVTKQNLSTNVNENDIDKEFANNESQLQKRRNRTRFSKQQLYLLETEFTKNQYPNLTILSNLSELLDLPLQRINVWFQNRRSRFKKISYKKSTEKSCAKLPIKIDDGIKIENFKNELTIITEPQRQQEHNNSPSIAASDQQTTCYDTKPQSLLSLAAPQYNQNYSFNQQYYSTQPSSEDYQTYYYDYNLQQAALQSSSYNDSPFYATTNFYQQHNYSYNEQQDYSNSFYYQTTNTAAISTSPCMPNYYYNGYQY